MRLVQFELSSFRSVLSKQSAVVIDKDGNRTPYTKSVQLRFCNDASPGINILIGENGSGKSNTLRAIEYFFTGQTSDRKENSPKGDNSPINLRAILQLSPAEVEEVNKLHNFSSPFKNLVSLRLVSVNDSIEYQIDISGTEKSPSTNPSSESFDAAVADVIAWIKSHFILLPILDTKDFNTFRKLTSKTRVGDLNDSTAIQSFSDCFENLATSIGLNLKLDSLADSFERLKFEDAIWTSPISTKSFGTQRLASLAFASTLPRSIENDELSYCLLIDDLEIGFIPHAMTTISNFLSSRCANTDLPNLSVIATSHSPFALPRDSNSRLIEIEVSEDKNSSAQVDYEIDRKSQSWVSNIDAVNVGNDSMFADDPVASPLKRSMSSRILGNRPRILVCEGPSDVAVIRSAINCLGNPKQFKDFLAVSSGNTLGYTDKDNFEAGGADLVGVQSMVQFFESSLDARVVGLYDNDFEGILGMARSSELIRRLETNSKKKSGRKRSGKGSIRLKSTIEALILENLPIEPYILTTKRLRESGPFVEFELEDLWPKSVLEEFHDFAIHREYSEPTRRKSFAMSQESKSKGLLDFEPSELRPINSVLERVVDDSELVHWSFPSTWKKKSITHQGLSQFLVENKKRLKPDIEIFLSRLFSFFDD